MPNAVDEWMPSRLLDSKKNFKRCERSDDDGAIDETDPLVLILTEKLIAERPVISLVLSPFRMDLSSDFGRQFVSQAFHGLPWRSHEDVGILQPEH